MIRLVDDVVAPAVVSTADIVTMEVAPDWNEWVAYIMAAGGYVAGAMGFGGNFAKNLGIASMDWAARSIYQRVKAAGATTKQVASRRVAFSPTNVHRSYEPEFDSVSPFAI